MLGPFSGVRMDRNPSVQDKDRSHASPRPNWFAAVAHDLRNPLAVIECSAARLLRDGSAERHIIDDGLQRILRSVHRAERLVEDLFDAMRESGTLDVRPTAVGAARLLADAKAVGEALAANASVTLDVQSASDLPTVRADADRIAQVFENLNVTKFTPQEGRVTLRARSVDDEVHFSIADTGRGLSEQDRHHVFAAYWQHDAADGRGRGLGLWICREIVEAHGGRIWIETGDAGTTVIFVLPSAESDG